MPVSYLRTWANALAACSPEFLTFIEQKITQVESFIDQLLAQESPFIRDAGRYIIGAGGKRLRPLLLITSAQLGDYRGDDDVLFGVVMEYIHTATLVHDDIIDNAYERRGQTSANRRWGNRVAVLLGDYFYTKAMDLALAYGNLQILRILSHITIQTLQGEIAEQLHDGNLAITESQIMHIIVQKTATLFSGCCQIAAILADFSPDHQRQIAQMGLNMGIAFQIVDDLLDYSADPSLLGKPVLKDWMEGKVTLPLYYLLQTAPSDEVVSIRNAFRAHPPSTVDRTLLRNLMEKYRVFERVQQVAEHYAGQALTLLANFPEGDARRLLEGLIRFILKRPW